MKNSLWLVAVVFVACGPMKPAADGGSIDTSCGVDCSAQKYFSILAGTCFEYSDSNSTASMTPSLGVLVKAPFTLEGNIPVMQMEYRIGGQVKMIDSFTFPNGELWLVRREWPAGGDSITFKDANDKIAGVQWLTQSVTAGGSLITNPKADIVDRSGTHTFKDESYRVTLATPTANELKTPLMNYTEGLTMLLGESPEDHGTDPKRIFVQGTGFVVISTSLQKTGGTALPRYLQKVRTGGDAGVNDCSL